LINDPIELNGAEHNTVTVTASDTAAAALDRAATAGA
jgi:hypothetical protein